jgi:thioredoxin reductase (NADPH)
VVSVRSVIIATGAGYNRLALDHLTDFEGVCVLRRHPDGCSGVWRRSHGHSWRGQLGGTGRPVARRTCSEVHLVIRGRRVRAPCHASWSSVLSKRPESISCTGPRSPRCSETEHSKASCAGQRATRRSCILLISGLFVFIGATPSTEWLQCQLTADEDGFLLTGANIPVTQIESVGRMPWLLETSRPGSSASAMSAADRSSALRRPSAKARWRCGSCSIASSPLVSQSGTRPGGCRRSAQPFSVSGAPPAYARCFPVV